ncbi:unnamed protein product [Prunus armeniaca]|uniref:Uncharacterized protein n=1 Tax=Prunus armeniaca TaxID=36596 RepID=A0A6J5V6Z0_PRUAR|nr:unnamed protein product [Prunus armeniaca]
MGTSTFGVTFGVGVGVRFCAWFSWLPVQQFGVHGNSSISPRWWSGWCRTVTCSCLIFGNLIPACRLVAWIDLELPLY